jgi:GT2 family glycosyltransferase
MLPSEVIIIDDGELENDYVEGHKQQFKANNINLIYYKKDHSKERRGLSESKNRGLHIASYDIVFFFDDDIIIDEKDFFEKIMDIWATNKDPDLIGVGGLIKDVRKKGKFEKIFNKVFGLTSKKYNWDVTDVGFQVWDEHIEERQEAFYVHGGVTSFKKNSAKKILFSTFRGGRTGLEDVDFCLRSKKQGYFFIVEPNARVIHNHVDTSRENDLMIGQKESKNRKEIFKKNCKKTPQNYFWFFWGNAGWILRSFIAMRFKKGVGMVKGLLF